MKFCSVLLLALFCASTVHGSFLSHFTEHLKHEVKKHKIDDFLHKVGHEIKGRGIGILTTELIPDLLTGVPSSITLDLLKDVGTTAVKAALVNSKFGKKVDTILHVVGTDVDHAVAKILPSRHHKVATHVHTALQKTLAETTSKVEKLKEKLNISLPEHAWDGLLKRSLASAAVATHIHKKMTEKLGEDLALHTHELAPMTTTRIVDMQRDFHTFLVNERRDLEARIVKMMSKEGVEEQIANVDSFIDHLVLSLPSSVHKTLNESLEEGAHIFVTTCLNQGIVLKFKRNRLGAEIKLILRDFIHGLELNLRRLLADNNVTLTSAKFQDLVQHGLRNAHYPTYDKALYLTAQSNHIVQSLTSDASRELHVSEDTVRVYVQNLLEDMSRTVGKDIPEAVASTLREVGIPASQAKAISDSVHKLIFNQFMDRKVDCRLAPGGKVASVKVGVHLDLATVENQKQALSAKITQEMRQTLNLDEGEVKIEDFEKSDHGTVAIVKVVLCKDTKVAVMKGMSAKTGNSLTTSSLKQSDHSLFSVPIIAGIATGSLILIFLLHLVVFAIVRKRRRSQQTSVNSDQSYQELKNEA